MLLSIQQISLAGKATMPAQKLKWHNGKTNSVPMLCLLVMHDHIIGTPAVFLFSSRSNGQF
jgi:hypothetical protein